MSFEYNVFDFEMIAVVWHYKEMVSSESPTCLYKVPIEKLSCPVLYKMSANEGMFRDYCKKCEPVGDTAKGEYHLKWVNYNVRKNIE